MISILHAMFAGSAPECLNHANMDISSFLPQVPWGWEVQKTSSLSLAADGIHYKWTTPSLILQNKEQVPFEQQE